MLRVSNFSAIFFKIIKFFYFNKCVCNISGLLGGLIMIIPKYGEFVTVTYTALKTLGGSGKNDEKTAIA